MKKVPSPLDVARGELGTTESPAGSNCVKYNTWFYGREVRDTADRKYPWCMAFVQWCFAQAGCRLPHVTASCGDLLSWYKRNCPERVVTAPQTGDIIIYNFGHTGIVEGVGVGKDAGYILAIEGNTSPGEVGSQSNGGGVFRRKRSKALVTAYIRPYDKYEEDDGVVTYKTLDDVPSWYKTAVQKAMDKDALKGTGKGEINVSEDLCKTLTVLDRLGKLD